MCSYSLNLLISSLIETEEAFRRELLSTEGVRRVSKCLSGEVTWKEESGTWEDTSISVFRYWLPKLLAVLVLL